MHICMKDMTPVDVLRFQAICREAHGLSADDVLVAKFAMSRWYYAGGSLSTWRAVWQQCVEATALKGWNYKVWAHAEMMLEAETSREFDDWSRTLSHECDYHDVWVPGKDLRALLVHGLEEHLTFITRVDQEVLGILAIFMLCTPCHQGWYWSFMLLLADGSFAAVSYTHLTLPTSYLV